MLETAVPEAFDRARFSRVSGSTTAATLIYAIRHQRAGSGKEGKLFRAYLTTLVPQDSKNSWWWLVVAEVIVALAHAPNFTCQLAHQSLIQRVQ